MRSILKTNTPNAELLILDLYSFFLAGNVILEYWLTNFIHFSSMTLLDKILREIWTQKYQ